MPQPTKDDSRDLSDLHPELLAQYRKVKDGFASGGNTLHESCTYRSTKRQAELYQIGRRGIPGEKTVTKCDGKTQKSRHNVYPAEAVDVFVKTNAGVVLWDRKAYEPLKDLCTKHGLIWGGSWQMDDYPHIELPANLS